MAAAALIHIECAKLVLGTIVLNSSTDIEFLTTLTSICHIEKLLTLTDFVQITLQHPELLVWGVLSLSHVYYLFVFMCCIPDWLLPKRGEIRSFDPFILGSECVGWKHCEKNASYKRE